jgi:proteasome lid subunit RPN8/RPN11
LIKLLHLNLTKDKHDQLEKFAHQMHPIEACALLLGNSSKNYWILEKFVKVKNVANSKIEFKIDPLVLLKEINKEENVGLDLIGFFHSHPAAAHPSSIDLQNMELWMNYVWIIYSSTENKMQAFLMEDNRVKEVYMKIS